MGYEAADIVITSDTSLCLDREIGLEDNCQHPCVAEHYVTRIFGFFNK